jgi:hypothetical protein
LKPNFANEGEKNMQNQCRSGNVQDADLRQRLSFLLTVSFLFIVAVLFSACTSQSTETTNVANIPTTVSTSTATSGSTTVSSPTATSAPYPVKVYFSKVNATNFDDVVAVNRLSPTLEVGTFAVEQVVAGPTSAEKNQGLFSQLHDSINGASNCVGQNATGDSDFLLALNKKGTTDEQGTATLQFCRDIASSGIGTDARIQSEVATTLKQFSSITKVVILLKNGHCFADGSGLDLCLK